MEPNAKFPAKLLRKVIPYLPIERMETITTDTALVESILWIPGALLYLPIGILAAVVLFEVIDTVESTHNNDRAVLLLLIFATVTTFISANLGKALNFFLGDWGNFPFALLLPGYALGLLVLATWAVKYLSHRSWLAATEAAKGNRKTKQRTSGSALLNNAYRALLVLTIIGTAICVSYKADLGETPAYVTLGYPGKAEEIPQPVIDPPPPVAPLKPIATVPSPEMAKAKTDPEPEPEVVEPEPPAEPQPQPMPKLAMASAPVPDNLTIDFLSQVEPILNRSCYDCHGISKDKGDLRIHTPGDIRKGGGDGPVVVVGKPQDSSLYFLTTLDPDDDDIMPGKGDPLTKEETEILRQWILEGAYLADGRKIDDPAALAMAGKSEEGEESEGDEMPLSEFVVIPNPEYLKMLRGNGIIVTETDEEHMLEIDYTKAGMEPGEIDLKVLFPLACNIVSLDLSKTKVADADTGPIEEFTNLRSIVLDRTNIGDDTLYALSGLKKLQMLSLFATRSSDSGIGRLTNLEDIKKLVLINTMVTANGANRLRKAFPDAVIQAPE